MTRKAMRDVVVCLPGIAGSVLLPSRDPDRGRRLWQGSRYVDVGYDLARIVGFKQPISRSAVRNGNRITLLQTISAVPGEQRR